MRLLMTDFQDSPERSADQQFLLERSRGVEILREVMVGERKVALEEGVHISTSRPVAGPPDATGRRRRGASQSMESARALHDVLRGMATVAGDLQAGASASALTSAAVRAAGRTIEPRMRLTEAAALTEVAESFRSTEPYRLAMAAAVLTQGAAHRETSPRPSKSPLDKSAMDVLDAYVALAAVDLTVHVHAGLQDVVNTQAGKDQQSSAARSAGLGDDSASSLAF
jgi:hypothetical protein